MSKSVKRVVKNSFFQTLGGFGITGLNFLLINGYGRILGPELFGSLATSQNQVILWSMLVDLGLTHSLIGALTSAESERSELSRQGFRARDLIFRVLALRLIGALLGTLTVYLFARAHNPPGSAAFWQDMAFTPFLFALALQQTAAGFAIYRGRQGLSVLAQLAGVFLTVALTLFLTFQGASLGWLLLSQSWGGIFTAAVVFGWFYSEWRRKKSSGRTRRIDRQRGGTWGKEAWGALLREAWPYAITYSVFVSWQRLDQLAVAYFLGEAQAGQYTMAVRLVAIPLLVATSISMALFPDLQRIGRDAPEKVRDVLGLACKALWRYGILIAALLLVAIALLMVPIQPQFKPALKLVPLFVPGVWGFWMQSFLMNALFGVRKYRLVVEAHLYSLAFFVSSLALLAWKFGLPGVVWSFNIFCLSMFYFGFRAARKSGLLPANYSLFAPYTAGERSLFERARRKAEAP